MYTCIGDVNDAPTVVRFAEMPILGSFSPVGLVYVTSLLWASSGHGFLLASLGRTGLGMVPSEHA